MTARTVVATNKLLENQERAAKMIRKSSKKHKYSSNSGSLEKEIDDNNKANSTTVDENTIEAIQFKKAEERSKIPLLNITIVNRMQSNNEKRKNKLENFLVLVSQLNP